MNYVFKGKVYEIDYVTRSLEDDTEIFLIDPDTRQAVSIHDLPDYVADDLYVVCYDLITANTKIKDE